MRDVPFTIDYFRRLLAVVTEHYECRRFRDAHAEPRGVRPVMLLRHDIDICLRRAVRMAEAEAAAGVSTTYFVMCRSDLYDVASPDGRSCIRALVDAGHEVGLHARSGGRDDEQQSPEALHSAIRAEADMLQELIDMPVRSVSSHRPHASILRGERLLGDRVNAYAAELMQQYLADSGGRWHVDDPIETLSRPQASVAQLVVHPFWWDEHDAAPIERIDAFVRGSTPSGTAEARASLLARVAAVVPRVFETAR